MWLSIDCYMEFNEWVEKNLIISNDRMISLLDFLIVHPNIFNHYHIYAIPNWKQSIVMPSFAYPSIHNNQNQYEEEEYLQNPVRMTEHWTYQLYPLHSTEKLDTKLSVNKTMVLLLHGTDLVISPIKCGIKSTMFIQHI